MTMTPRNQAKFDSINRKDRKVDLPKNQMGNRLRVTDYFGENVFDYQTADGIPEKVKNELRDIATSGKVLGKQLAGAVAKAASEWAIERGATHFCHWFQPLTGATAEKHDAFLSYDKNGQPIEYLSASQLVQGEPDASSFPNGGVRSTFEARGYTSWDLTSPMFLIEDLNGKTLCIPTAFVSYHGDALDIKTPLLRSVTKLNESATRFLNLIGEEDVKSVVTTCGAEQEYFLIDKSFYYSRPDLVMTGRTLFGSLTARNQQLDDHYFGAIPERVMGFMQELDHELYRLGIPAKTRHNEVAPAQFELAQIFRDANVSADNNQLVMRTIKSVAEKHDLVALIHEKPFAGINGSGKHLNWSIASDTGINLLEPGDNPHQNMGFLAFTAIVVEAVKRHSKLLRCSIASQGNDHRLGANEAPPSIISVFLGDTLTKIYESMMSDSTFTAKSDDLMGLGADQLAHLFKDNTDRNRTSPFAFTGNKFEFRAVGSSANIGFPMTVLNSAVASVLDEANTLISKNVSEGQSVDEALISITKGYLESSWNVVFNGDGYSDEWIIEAEKRGLPNLRTTADALPVLMDEVETKFLKDLGVYKSNELEMRYNVLVERYNLLREIEFNTLSSLVFQEVLPAAVSYKDKLGRIIKNQKSIGFDSNFEFEIYKELNIHAENLFKSVTLLNNELEAPFSTDQEKAQAIASRLMPVSEDIAKSCAKLEEIIPSEIWSVPSYFDILFLR